MKPIFNRSEKNPIITPRSLPFPAEAVLNPGAAEMDGEIVLLLRVEHTSGYSSIYVARSANGVTDWRIRPEPLLRCGQPRWPYERWGCEDPRVTYIADQKSWYITYTAYSGTGAAVGLARTKDFVKAERIGLIFSPNNKDAALFPEKFKHRWAVLHRPEAGGVENIWIAYSPDLIHWGEPHCVLPEGRGPAWDAVKVGAGPPPIPTEHGWLLLYHGVKRYAGQLVYRVGAALLDRKRPHRLIARSHECIFKATALYETTGLVPNVVFPTGLVQRGDELWMYYGAADTCVCLATVRLQDVLDTLEVETGPSGGAG
ncbi:MAG TPA: glycosidase [Planctomycetota bacterium]|nr:glycosidase [Planctomycetota bacterium]